MKAPCVVIKVGGSLFDWPGLPAALTRYLDARRSEARLAVIAGGGPAADIVRNLDRVHGLGEELSHQLALHALQLTRICSPRSSPAYAWFPCTSSCMSVILLIMFI